MTDIRTWKVTKANGGRKYVRLYTGTVDGVWEFAKHFMEEFSAPVFVERMTEDGMAWESCGSCWY